jgi:Rps23 Pro-64 3,4-dihydroxylase Tpa1-like proline 4-hydroxylase
MATTTIENPQLAGTETLFSESFHARLKSLASESAERYQSAHPFPSIYFDNFLPIEAAEAAHAAFPQPKQAAWTKFNDPNQKKLAFDAVERLPQPVRDVLYFMNSRPMVDFLETLTGIEGVISDPYYVGGGLHQIVPGGKLDVHADFNTHTKLKLDRRINVLIYMNKDWHEEYGGHFELWDKEMKQAEAKILPLFNRCAIFSTTSTSYHGHPTPLACPPDRTRKSIATYYYTNGRPEEEVNADHSTLFMKRPEDKVPSKVLSEKTKSFAKAILPPILYEALRPHKD